MTSADALREIQGFFAANRFEFDPHVLERTQQRNVKVRDVRHAIANATSCMAAPNGRWRVEGEDVDGDALTMICVIDNGVVIVTVF